MPHVWVFWLPLSQVRLLVVIFFRGCFMNHIVWLDEQHVATDLTCPLLHTPGEKALDD